MKLPLALCDSARVNIKLLRLMLNFISKIIESKLYWAVLLTLFAWVLFNKNSSLELAYVLLLNCVSYVVLASSRLLQKSSSFPGNLFHWIGLVVSIISVFSTIGYLAYG